MPRGRKGPPQESVDSILLAISRRDDIDADTLSHYFDRLDEEWTGGAREKVLHLLRTNDQSAHAAAILILAELATDLDLETLEDFVTDPTVSDVAKLSLSPVLKELGSEMADDGIIEYLNDPAGAMHAMQTRLLELVGQSEMGVESVLEDVAAMPVERRLAFVYWLGGSNDPRAAHLLIPLLENPSSKVAVAAIEALEHLGQIAATQAIPALNHLIATTSNRTLKQNARAVLGRLTMLSAPGAEDAAMAEAREAPLPSYKARVSFIDGSGTQLIMLSWQRPDGLLKGVNVLFQDQWGIKDCYGLDEMEVRRWEDLITDLQEQGFMSFQTPFEYARTLVVEARALNRRTRRKLPVAYSIWRPLIEAVKPEQKEARTFPTILEPQPLDEQVIALAQHGADLYHLSEFTSWLYQPTSDIDPYTTRYWSTYTVFEGSSSKRGRTKKGKQKEQNQQNQQNILEDLISEAISNLLNDKWRTLYETRLRRLAAFFLATDREQEVALMRAVAAVLQAGSSVPLQEQAFVRAMMRISIENGPLRMMIEALGSGDLGPFPFNIFKSDE
ncbi:MAG: HEAT repeat domain-containing protein [Chloroflexi bacterium]|nr:MAG: HEAT repeat domain-containing protein [Chloroflexota bacterium]